MRYYQCERYPIEFVLSENIDKCFDCHNHVGHYVISLVMQGEVTVYLESRKLVCHEGDVFTIPPYAVHSVCQGREARLLSMCIGTAFAAETDFETAEVIVRELLLQKPDKDDAGAVEEGRHAGCHRACREADGEHIGGDGGGQHEPPGGGRRPEPEVPRCKGTGRVHDVPGGRHGRAAAE